NARLYSEIPLRGVSLPVSRARSWFRGLTGRGRVSAVLAGVGLVLGLGLAITPERAGGGGGGKPLPVQGGRGLPAGGAGPACGAGGETVQRGQTLAVVEDLDLAGRIAGLKAEIEGERRDLAAARLAGDVAAWRTHEIRVAGLENTLAIEERRADARVLSAPF